jgi:hypothetical protein
MELLVEDIDRGHLLRRWRKLGVSSKSTEIQVLRHRDHLLSWCGRPRAAFHPCHERLRLDPTRAAEISSRIDERQAILRR